MNHPIPDITNNMIQKIKLMPESFIFAILCHLNNAKPLIIQDFLLIKRSIGLWIYIPVFIHVIRFICEIRDFS